MRDILKEFDNNIKVIREWGNDDTGKPDEVFIIYRDGEEVRRYRSRERAMERAISLSSRTSRRNRAV